MHTKTKSETTKSKNNASSVSSFCGKQKAIQAKLSVGKPNDIYEQEADSVAERIMTMPEPKTQRQIEEEPIQEKRFASQITPWVQRQYEKEDEKPIQAFQIQRELWGLVGGEVTNDTDQSWLISGGSNSKPEHFFWLLPGKNSDDIPEVDKLLNSDVDAVWPNGKNIKNGKTKKVVNNGVFKLKSHQNANIEGNSDVGYVISDFWEYFAEGKFPGGWSIPGKFRTNKKKISGKNSHEENPIQKKYDESLMKKPNASIPQTASSWVESKINNSKGGGRSLPKDTRSFMENRFGADFGKINIHTDSNAVQMNNELNAQAFTHGNDVYFNSGKFNTDSTSGKQLLAHELTHTVQQNNGLKANKLQRITKGKTSYNKARKWINEDAKIKIEVDVLKSALREIRKGKSVSYNEKAGIKKINNVGSILALKKAAINLLIKEFKWLVKNRKSKDFNARRAVLLKKLKSPLKNLKAKYPKQQTHYWLKNSPAQFLEIIYKVANKIISPIELWAYAFKEGIDKYVRKQIGISATTDPTEAQLGKVSISKSVSGFGFLGLDDFMTDLKAKRKPLIKFLPKGYDLKKVKEVKKINEHGRTVRSGKFPNMLMAIQAFEANLRRRRSLFIEDAKKYKYKKPTQDELVYWTYVYYNYGEFGGKAQLKKYQKTRNLSTWIKKGEFSNSIKLLESYKMVKAMKIF